MFWKLLLAFWLATTMTFLVGVGLFMFSRLGSGDPSFNTVLDNEVRILKQSGIPAAQALLDAWQPGGDHQVGLYDHQGHLLAGRLVDSPQFEMSVRSWEGTTVWIRSSLRPTNENGPSHIAPLITGTFMSALFSWFLSSYLVAPLMKLREAMGKVASGRFDTRVKPVMGRRRDEIVDLAEDCDRMANQLKVMAESRQQLLHDISHELRSPLTRMNAAIGLLLQEPGQLDMLGRIERESEKMDALIEELLTLARMQSHPGSLEREEVDVISLLAAIVEDAEFEAGIKQCRVRLQAPMPFMAHVDSELLYRAFENVIRNAVRHTAVGTDVMVVANQQASPSTLTVTIIDHGPGVDEQCLQRIFQPFERGADNPSQGFGLGLAIAQRAVEVHGGMIAAHNRPEGGLVVEIALPAR
ncbi:HAMP domain-containing protein [Pseudomonas viridiflava]|uniref:HAMP domain-containing sensor histidine kinase n=1 Tax=Pseudomonas viridiflava TaxID=33069 RepID=UPI0018E648AE|nr:ATP-binding protein [Pseudomonas viridiflava]MBI6681620.1 HAMP domain-containing protein [Pseudomonas viridiflava]